MFGVLFFSLLYYVVYADKYYTIKPYEDSSVFPHYGNFSVFDTKLKRLSFIGNFTFDVHDRSSVYYFIGGPTAVNRNLNYIYLPITSGNAFKRLLLVAYNYKTKTYHQSRWVHNDGNFGFLFYNPLRKRLFGLRTNTTFTYYIEEYDIETLDTVKLYTQQDVRKYAFINGRCTAFDYNQNWIIQVRVGFDNSSYNSYWIKMDLNLVGKKEDIVTDFHLMPRAYYFLTMTYDIQKTKLIFCTWQNGSSLLDIYMFHLDPKQNGKFPYRNQRLKLLLKTNGEQVETVRDVWNPVKREILYLIQTNTGATRKIIRYMLRVQFDTRLVLEKTILTDKQLPLLDSWEYFYLS
ncbi:unnamed protein product [Rotaria socialis]|uniref:Uncharacterized protein n=1 Tax=Rotaria socialis TaxID=392032 RepID=A0A818U9S3_9BILA|nr:unnamed protein product [Rotaria socialis]CAF3366948.1 unnamed protein product [Rotaria socialis]CAF3468771.1 unnamed protein product [Rotaria socialis]CAF3552165.1 unnamed protein product [Rotaria socialis]CAF3695437.1 unnamed protein product [Rotaria socialis]